MIIAEEDYLEHFGVKGMHWGVRNARNARSARSQASKNRRKALKNLTRDPGAQRAVGMIAGGVALSLALNVGGNHVDKMIREHGLKQAAGVLFQKGGTTVFKPGTFHPGDFMDASIPVRQLTQAAKALAA